MTNIDGERLLREIDEQFERLIIDLTKATPEMDKQYILGKMSENRNVRIIVTTMMNEVSE